MQFYLLNNQLNSFVDFKTVNNYQDCIILALNKYNSDFNYSNQH